MGSKTTTEKQRKCIYKYIGVVEAYGLEIGADLGFRKNPCKDLNAEKAVWQEHVVS